MNNRNLIFWAKIYLQSIVSTSNDSDIGLYTDIDGGSNISVFRWIETDISAYSPTFTFKAGILLQNNAFGDINENIPLPFDGGDTAKNDSCSITIANSIEIGGSVQSLYKFLTDNGISFYNLRTEIGYFEIVSGALVSVSGDQIYVGNIDDEPMDVESLTLNIIDFTINRSVNIGGIIDKENYTNPPIDNIGSKINATLGTFYNEYNPNSELVWGGLAKADKVESAEVKFKTGYNIKFAADIFLDMLFTDDINLTMFPIVSSSAGANPIPKIYSIKIGAHNGFWKNSAGVQYVASVRELTEWQGLILNVVGGIGEGQSAEIASAQVNLDTDPYSLTIDIQLKNFLFTTLVGNATATYTDNTWVEIISSTSKFKIDEWPLRSFIDGSKNEISSGFQVFSYENTLKNDPATNNVSESAESFKLLSSFDISTNSDKNEINLGASFLSRNVNTVSGYVFIPPASIDYFTPDWVSQGTRFGLSYLINDTNIGRGFYEGIPGTSSKITIETGAFDIYSPNDAITTNGAGGFFYTVTLNPALATYQSDVSCCLKIEIPKNLSFDFSEVYLGIRCGVDTTNLSSGRMTIYTRSVRFLGNYIDSNDTYVDSITGATNGEVNNLPDSFYSSNPTSTSDLLFYYDGDNWVNSGVQQSSGLTLFPLTDINNKNIYANTKYIYVVIRTQVTTDYIVDPGTCEVSLYNVSLVYKKTQSTKNSVYTSIKGRIFDDDWNGRKTDTSQILDPIDMIEHLKRLGNWTNYGATNEFGKEYATEALIDEGSNRGSFDSNALDYLRTARPSLQISAEINEIVQIICRDYWLVSLIESDSGAEQVLPVFQKDSTPPSLTITYGDIIGKVKKMYIPPSKKIYCQPIVKYAYNNASKTYDKTIRITNTNKASYNSSYVVGISGSTSELLWNKGKLLFDKYRVIEDPPTRLVEKRSIVNDDEALNYLNEWFTIMGVSDTDGSVSGLEFDPRLIIEFTISINIGLSIFKGNNFKLQLKHQTNSEIIECRVLSIKKSISSGLCDIRAMLFGFSEAIEYFIQDVTSTTDPEWVETSTPYSTHGEGFDIEEVS